ncbi:MAG: helix-turn-helix transcriptional regulator, partial [Lachnospiraceae bacterium]|nr:helix-turn-helix transcriptional regulator [Lachnospiraceae bacterium]
MSKQVGTLIKEARVSAGMTQKELAEAVDGVSASSISKAERGVKELTPEQLQQIAEATGASYESFLVGDDDSTACCADTEEVAEETCCADTEEACEAETEAAEEANDAPAADEPKDEKQQSQNPMAMFAGMMGGFMGN